MPNGKPGDHPYTDIVVHGQDVYSPKAASLVREIARLADDRTKRTLQDLLLGEFNDLRSPNVPKLEQLLTDMRDKLRRDAKERGYELD